MIQREARRGLADASLTLPHSEQIQAAFGHHDVSHVRTSIGGTARSANQRMGALAFTSGDRIGFRESPSLHLAAHEAAHVIQQREGLSLPGNVGRAGDRWEQHADRVADAVVSGRSAEPVLDEVAVPSASSNKVAESDSSLAASTSDVQRQITSGASRLFESAPVTAEAPGAAEERNQEIPEEGSREAAPTERGEEGSALDAAVEGESEAPPEGIPVEGQMSAGGGGATSAAGTPASIAGASTVAAESRTSTEPATPAAVTPTPTTGPEISAQGATAETPSGGGINAPCYNIDPPPPPDNAREPTSDERGSEPEEQPQVTFEPWPAEADECPAEDTVAEASAQMPEGLGTGEVTTSGAHAAGGISTTAVIPEGESNTRAIAMEGAASSSSSEVQQMARTATASAEQITASTSDMDGQIANAEGERDTAVNDYLASTSLLPGVLARARSLESGVTFPTAKGAQQFEVRQVAISQVRDFMARAAEQIAAAVDFAQEQMPDMLRAAAESANANIQDAIDTEKTAISDRIAQARAQALAGAATARAQIHAEYVNSASMIETVTVDALAALDTTYTASIDLVDEKETGGLDDVNSRFATGREQHEAKGPEYASRAIARGQDHAAAYEHCKGNYSDDGFWDGCLTVRRAKAQQDAACKTAAGYKDTFLRTANKKGYDLIALRRQYRCAVIAGARQVNQTIDTTYDQLISGLESGRTQALEGITLARDENLAAIDNALAATLRSLSAQEYSQRQAVNDTGYLKQAAVEQLAHAGAAGLVRGITVAMDSLEQTLVTLRESFAQGDIPDPMILAQSLATTEAALGGGMGTLLDTMMNGSQQTGESITGLEGAALEALAMLTAKNDELSIQVESGFTQQMNSLTVGASAVFSQLTDNHIQQARQAMTEGVTSIEQVVAGFDDALGTIGGRIDEAITTSLEEIDQELNTKFGELDGQIAREAWKAAEKEQPAWKSVVAIILVIVVIIAAAVISIVTLGAGASLFAVILVGALVGAVSGGLIQLINNWASGEVWHTGLVQAMVMGAIGGAIGGGLGFAGGALSAGAAAAGARAATQFAITLGADLASEALTQTAGYFLFGQEFNWQGFVMAGAMSGVSFRAQPSGASAAVTRAAGGAGARRAAVTQIAGGAALGFGLEAGTAYLSGQEFDLTRAASSAASAAVSARMSRRGGPSGPASEPTTRLGRAVERFRSFDPGRIGARLESRLQGLGGRIAGTPPETVPPIGARAPTTEELPITRAPEESTPMRPITEEPSSTHPRAEEPTTRSVDEPVPGTGRRPLNAESAVELAGPANRMNEQDLIDATTTRVHVGNTDHDFRITRECEVCTACGPTKLKLNEMIEALPPGRGLRRELERLRVIVDDVETRLAGGESGRQIVRDSARIAAEFRVLGGIHPSLGRSLQEPQLRQARIEGPEGAVITSTHLRDLDADIVRTERLDIEGFGSSSLARGEPAVYILRDSNSGAILKVGVAEKGRARFGSYRTAGNNLDLRLQLDIAVVTPRGGRTIRDIEAQLRARLENEGHVLPWDATASRLGRFGQGTPFVYQSGFLWTKDGRRVSLPEAVASLRLQGKSNDEIVRQLAETTTSSENNIRRWIVKFNTNIQAIESAMNSGGG
ncbi:eCIS core domain-containing protein [Nitrosomonas nitrosa]|uniref:eCIS core domain-containing protein n=1 Tax=Nitrosomonas nitrosa TaxID=52442 RepID=UPI0023F7528A|nr:DUF4157 domain-containing protein [Nitrosomonas nitrosa]MCO6433786.1 DUF4157 domain-containing protein [Nitrosomonas nitrosa]